MSRISQRSVCDNGSDRVPDTLLRGFAALLLGVRHLLTTKGSFQRPTRHLFPLGAGPARGSERRSPPLAQGWRILGVELKGPRREDQDASDGISCDWSVAFREALWHKECRPPGLLATPRKLGMNRLG